MQELPSTVMSVAANTDLVKLAGVHIHLKINPNCVLLHTNCCGERYEPEAPLVTNSEWLIACAIALVLLLLMSELLSERLLLPAFWRLRQTSVAQPWVFSSVPAMNCRLCFLAAVFICVRVAWAKSNHVLQIHIVVAPLPLPEGPEQHQAKQSLELGPGIAGNATSKTNSSMSSGPRVCNKCEYLRLYWLYDTHQAFQLHNATMDVLWSLALTGTRRSASRCCPSACMKRTGGLTTLHLVTRFLEHQLAKHSKQNNLQNMIVIISII